MLDVPKMKQWTVKERSWCVQRYFETRSCDQGRIFACIRRRKTTLQKENSSLGKEIPNERDR